MRKLLVGMLVAFSASTASAFCGFYVSGANAKLYSNATMVVMMRDGARTVLAMQNNYQGPPESFAMVVPVPVVLQKENVKTLPREIFDKVDSLAAPRLVEYWEQDPCHTEDEWDDKRPMMADEEKAEGAAPSGGKYGVKIEAQFTVGEYEIVVLSAQDSTGLDTWLKLAGYKIPDGAEPYLRPYVQGGSKFFVAKVDPQKVKFENGQAVLSPLRFHYDTDQFTLPIRLGLANSSGTQDLIVHILARGQRYEVANYDNVTIPTNLDVAETAKDQYPSFYAALFDAVLAKHPKSVVTEYSWDSGSCDPCPIPPLEGSDLMTLGADVLPVTGRLQDIQYSGFVLTRLHARYSKDALGDDLVFRAAQPIVGGRGVPGEAKLDEGAQPSGSNNFQGRYIIKHPWTGPVACANPIRNRWGGPPGSHPWDPPPPPAPTNRQTMTNAPRNVSLASFVKEDVPDVGYKAAAGPLPPPTKVPPSANRGCACDVGGHAGAGLSGGLLLGIAGLAFFRRRRN